MPKRRGRVCILASGGVDSAALLGWALERFETVQPLYVRSGLRWERAEQHWLKRFLRAVRRPGLAPLEVLDLPTGDLYRRHWSTGAGKVPSADAPWDSVYLPGRNLLLLSKAGVFCADRGFGAVAIGTLSGNPFRDATPGFYRGMESLFRTLFGPIRVLAPFAALSKGQVVRGAAGLPLHLTFSCLAPKGVRPCGRCTKCFERRQGLA